MICRNVPDILQEECGKIVDLELNRAIITRMMKNTNLMKCFKVEKALV